MLGHSISTWFLLHRDPILELDTFLKLFCIFALREAWIICPHLRSSFFFFSSKCHWQERRGHIFWSAALFRLQILSVYRKIHPELAVYWANNTYHCPEANLAPTRRSIHNFTTNSTCIRIQKYTTPSFYMQQYLYEIRLRVRSRLKTGI